MSRLYPVFVTGPGAAALLMVRLVMGAAFLFHGWPKIQNPFGWMAAVGLAHFDPIIQAVAAYAEVIGGAALLLGLLTPVAAFLLLCQMSAALLLVHLPHHDPFVRVGGSSFELPLLYLSLAILFLFLGPGRFSLDALWVHPHRQRK
ncbi:MAG: DoxX family protein [Deltaproteobacteria bacterium]